MGKRGAGGKAGGAVATHEQKLKQEAITAKARLIMGEISAQDEEEAGAAESSITHAGESKTLSKQWKRAALVAEASASSQMMGKIAQNVEEKAVIYMKYSPFPHIPGGDHVEIGVQNAIEMHWCRFLWIFIFFITYFKAVTYVTKDKDMLAAEAQDLLGEFFPDQTVSAERFTKGEIAPAFAELLNGDDVSKLLNWFQAFCMYKTGSDEHIPFGWNCGIEDIKMEDLHPTKWDMITNSPPSSETTNESAGLIPHFCTDNFIKTHIISGDDPRVVPWGDTEAFRKLVRQRLARDEGKIASDEYMFDGTYDEWAILNGNPWLNILMRAAEAGYNQSRNFEKDPEKRWEIRGPNSQTSYLVPKGYSGPYQEPLIATTDYAVQAEEDPDVAKNEEVGSGNSLNEIFKYYAEREKEIIPQKQYKNISQKGRSHSGIGVPKLQSHNDKFLTPTATGTNDNSGSGEDELLSASEDLEKLTKQVIKDTLMNLFKRHPKNASLNEGVGHAPSLLEAPSGTDDVTTMQENDERTPDQDWLEGDKAHWNEATKQVMKEEAVEEPDYGEVHAGLAGATPQGLMPYWCFLPHSKLLNLFDRMQTLDIIMYGSSTIPKSHVAKLFWYYGIQDEATFEEVYKRVDKNNDGNMDYLELVNAIGRGGEKALVKGDDFRGIRPVCKNHHFGMLHMCGPETIEVTWRVEKQVWDDMPKTKDTKQHAKLHRHSVVQLVTRFDQRGMDTEDPKDGPTGWYTCSLAVDTYDFFGKQDNITVVLGILTLLLFFLIFLIDGLLNVLFFPFSVIQSFCTNKDEITRLQQVQDRINNLIDIRGSRSRYMGTLHIMMENLFALLFVLAVSESTWSVLTKATIPLRNRDVAEDCKRLYDEGILPQVKAGGSVGMLKVTSYEYMYYCLKPEDNFLAEFLAEFVLSNEYMHGVAMLVLSLRLLDLFGAFEATVWLGQTMTLAARKIVYFFCFYTYLIMAFGALVHVSHGSHFLQYRSWWRSVQVLALFSFGFDGYAFEGVHTFEDHSSFLLTMELLLFSIVIATIAMNFFLTIILDSYSMVKGGSFKEKLEEEESYLVKTVAFFFFSKVDVDQHLRSSGGFTLSRIMRQSTSHESSSEASA